MLYQNVYNKLIVETAGRTKFKGCHKHRVLQGYAGGKYAVNNVLYLTQREHCIIHFLLWKLGNDTRDKRAYKMIGVGPRGLTYDDRVEHGRMCAEEKKGLHDDKYKHSRKHWQSKGHETQRKKMIDSGEKNWYYWSTAEGRKERASLGGKASYGNNKAFLKQQSSFNDKSHAAAASSKSAKKPVTNGFVIKKFHTEEQVKDFLVKNTEWRRGCPTKKEKLELVK